MKNMLFLLMLSISPLFAQSEYVWDVTNNAVGRAAVIWSSNTDKSIRFSEYSVKTDAWTPYQVIPGSEAFQPTEILIEMDKRGNIIVVWGNDSGVIASSVKLSGRPWSTTTVLSTEGSYCVEPLISLDSAGNATLIWMNQTQGIEACYLKARKSDWSPPQTLSLN